MIIYTVNGLKIYETRSDKPNEDWTGKAEYIIDENDPAKSELIAKVMEYAPYFDYVTDLDDSLTDVTKTGTMVYETPINPMTELRNENRQLKAQVKALTESTQMLEECIVEMAEIVYA